MYIYIIYIFFYTCIYIRIHNTYVPTYVRPTKGRQAQSRVKLNPIDRPRFRIFTCDVTKIGRSTSLFRTLPISDSTFVCECLCVLCRGRIKSIKITEEKQILKSR